jgi:hypothetical protein
MVKITPEMKAFIAANCALSSRTLESMILAEFGVKYCYRSIENHLKTARREAEASNAAKVESVRSKILDDADAYAGKYLRVLDEEIEAWRDLLTKGEFTFPDNRAIQINDIKDRQAASQSLHKYISTVIGFVKPSQLPILNDDLDERLDDLIKRRQARIN